MQKTENRTVLTSGNVHWIRVEQIRPNPNPHRRPSDPAALRALTASIRADGILEPLTLRRTADGPELVAGERRLQAARLAGLREVPCVYVTDGGMETLAAQLRRKEWNYLEQAEGLARLMHDYRLSQEQAAACVGMSQSAVANKLRILRHPQPVLDALRRYNLSERHARALLRLPEHQRLAAAETIARHGWTVAETEQYLDSLLSPDTDPDVQRFLHALRRSLEKVHRPGVACGREETEEEIILTIRLPRAAG